MSVRVAILKENEKLKKVKEDRFDEFTFRFIPKPTLASEFVQGNVIKREEENQVQTHFCYCYNEISCGSAIQEFYQDRTYTVTQKAVEN